MQKIIKIKRFNLQLSIIKDKNKRSRLKNLYKKIISTPLNFRIDIWKFRFIKIDNRQLYAALSKWGKFHEIKQVSYLYFLSLYIYSSYIQTIADLYNNILLPKPFRRKFKVTSNQIYFFHVTVFRDYCKILCIHTNSPITKK